MPSQLTCRPELDFPVALLRVTGALDMITAPTLRSAMHGCLANQPEAVLVDVAGLEVQEPLALSVFAAVARQAADWPAVPVVLCRPDTVTAHRLARSPVRRSIEVAASCEEALARAGARTRPARLRRTLQPVIGACRQAREAVQEFCARWNLSDLAGSACVIASELVANVVRYAHTPMQFSLAANGRRLSVAVRDGSLAMPQPRALDPAVPGGRGLLLVRELADRWGTLSVSDGKVVWATLAAP
ncbi:MAG TPA: ATP-binding protein [Catenuloplanes sp.]|jgi:anti-anti-sigma regulatory factor/anti-sigma regulatory factor (Ser/Thr protein kinase)